MTARNIADVICIGAQKASTSWLHSVLTCFAPFEMFPDHDPITSTTKEAHFWDWNHHRGVEWYRDLMARPAPDSLMLDFTPEYAILNADQIAECKELNPDAKVIYLLRDPTARAISALKMYMLWHLGEGHTEPLKLGDIFEKLMKDARVPRHADYAGNAARWRAQYPDMLILNYEDFHTDREASIRQVLSYLGAADTQPRPAEALRFQQLLTSRVWESADFAISREVQMYLHGQTWAARLEAERSLGMRFTEFDPAAAE